MKLKEKYMTSLLKCSFRKKKITATIQKNSCFKQKIVAYPLHSISFFSVVFEVPNCKSLKITNCHTELESPMWLSGTVHRL